MKYIKSINEFFDTEDLKSQMEIDYLQGSIPFKDMVKDKNISKQKDLLLSKLLMNCPFIMGLNFTRINDNLLQIGFKQDFTIDDEVVITYYVIEIMEHKGSETYLSNIYAKATRNGKVIFDETINVPMMRYKDLVGTLNARGLDLLIYFSKWTEKNFQVKYFPYTNRSDVNRLNRVGVN